MYLIRCGGADVSGADDEGNEEQLKSQASFELVVACFIRKNLFLYSRL